MALRQGVCSGSPRALAPTVSGSTEEGFKGREGKEGKLRGGGEVRRRERGMGRARIGAPLLAVCASEELQLATMKVFWI